MIAIIDYEAGNLTSVRLAFETLGIPVDITRSPERVVGAERVVLPGVGAAGSAMDRLRASGMDKAIREVVRSGRPFMGICLGSQIILGSSEEDGGVDGLGIMAGCARRFRPSGLRDKVPQMGWNNVRLKGDHPVFRGVDDNAYFYFVHSYYPCPLSEDEVVGETEYAGVTFASVIGRANILAMQFHPEKSGRFGMKLLENFCGWDGKYLMRGGVC